MTDDNDLPIDWTAEDFLLSWYVAIDGMCNRYLLQQQGGESPVDELLPDAPGVDGQSNLFTGRPVQSTERVVLDD
jgi:hypothetical protein